MAPEQAAGSIPRGWKTTNDGGSLCTRIVQPKEVLEFYRELVKEYGYTLETAGALDGGRKVWALPPALQRISLRLCLGLEYKDADGV